MTDRNTPRRDGVQVNDPVAAGVVIYTGALYSLDADGNAVPAGTPTAVKVRAVAQNRADNATGAAGDVSCAGRVGCFRLDNSGSTDAIVRADIGSTCYVVDDTTVAKTDGGGARAAAGKVIDVDEVGVWVSIS